MSSWIPSGPAGHPDLGTIDFDTAKFRSDYKVELQIRDAAGNMASKVLYATTPSQKSHG